VLDNYVCACTVSAWIPQQVANLSLEMDSAIAISCMMQDVSHLMQHFV